MASYCKAETTFTFHFFILTLSSAFLSINNREMKSESGFSFAMASKPFIKNSGLTKWTQNLRLEDQNRFQGPGVHCLKIEENKSGLEFNFPLKSNCASLNFEI